MEKKEAAKTQERQNHAPKNRDALEEVGAVEVFDRVANQTIGKIDKIFERAN